MREVTLQRSNRGCVSVCPVSSELKKRVCVRVPFVLQLTQRLCVRVPFYIRTHTEGVFPCALLLQNSHRGCVSICPLSSELTQRVCVRLPLNFSPALV